MTSKLSSFTAVQLLTSLRAGSCKVSEVVADCLAQIQQFEPHVHAWAHLNPQLAHSKAVTLDQQWQEGKTTGPLFGVPIGIKDVFNTIDMPTEMGSPIWKGFLPGNDARTVHYLKMAQALILGKTVTAEFAVHAPGPTRNPYNSNYMPGTSSSGSAAAVACRMTPLTLGTQTAGSIIRPASYCGVYGFKPSFGLIPRTGVLKTTDTLDTIGGFARCIEDLQLLFETIRVKGRDFPVSEKHLNDPVRRDKPKGRPWRIGLVRGPKWDYAEIYAQVALMRFAHELSQQSDIEVSEIELPAGFEQAHQIHSTIYDKTLSYYFKREFEKHELVSRSLYDIVTSGLQISLEQYQQALQQQQKLSSSIDQMLGNDFDFLLGLSTGGEALDDPDAVDRPDNCLIWTLCGIPALNLPLFTGPKQLPFGAQLVSRRYSDYLLLNFAKQLEQRGLAGTVVYPSPSVVATPFVSTPVAGF